MQRSDNTLNNRGLSRRALLKSAPIGAIALAAKPVMSLAAPPTNSQYDIGFLPFEFDEGVTIINPVSAAHSIESGLLNGVNISISGHLDSDIDNFNDISFDLFLVLDEETDRRQLLWAYSNKGVLSQSPPIKFYSPLNNHTLNLQLVTRISYKDRRPDFTEQSRIVFSSEALSNRNNSNIRQLREGTFFVPLIRSPKDHWYRYSAINDPFKETLQLSTVQDSTPLSMSFLQIAVADIMKHKLEPEESADV